METITQQEYQARIIHGLVLVDFYAPWCEPCLLLEKILQGLESDFPEFAFYRLNCDENQDIVKEQKILSIPTLLLYRDSKLLKEINGLQTSDSLERILAFYGEKAAQN